MSILRKVVAAGLVFGLLGCGPEAVDVLEDETLPAVPVVSFRGPQTASTHTEVQNVRATVDAMNGFNGYFIAFVSREPSTTGKTHVWTYTSGSMTLTLRATRQSSGEFLWELIRNGTDIDGSVYSNWKELEGTAERELRNARWVVFESNTTSRVADFEWTTNAGTLNGAYKVYRSGSLVSQITVVNRADGSGEVNIFQSATLVYRATWQPNGTGQWWYYNPSSQVTSSGSW
jgi:hypothetical protein